MSYDVKNITKCYKILILSQSDRIIKRLTFPQIDENVE